MLPGDDPWNDRFLKRTEVTPTQTVDDVMLQGRMEKVKVAHRSSSISSTFETAMACRSTWLNSASLSVSAVVGTRVEVLELIDPIQEFPDEFLQEDAWGHTNPPAELARHRVCQARDQRVIAHVANSLSGSNVLTEDVTNSTTHLAEFSQVECRQSNLNRAGCQSERPFENRHAAVEPAVPAVVCLAAPRRRPGCR